MKTDKSWNIKIKMATKDSYNYWDVSKKSFITYGGKNNSYLHRCPKDDFFQITENILELFENNKLISKRDIINKMHNQKLSNNRIFKKISHEYKVRMVFYVLSEEGLIRRKNTKPYRKGKGRAPSGYKLNVKKEIIRKWLNEF